MTEKKQLLQCAVWIGALLLLGALLVFFTAPVRQELLLSRINDTLKKNGFSCRAGLALTADSPARLGQWFSLRGRDGWLLALVITRGTQQAACAALVSVRGDTEKILPLSTRSAQVLEDMSEGEREFYRKRIYIEAEEMRLDAVPGGMP